MAQSSLFWHDYETFGIDPRRDRPAQFAGVRTDLDFNIIDDPVVAYCKPPADYLPDPEACLLTGISPQLADARGINEAEFCRIIHEQFTRPNTCSLGYNTIRFDDEFTRNCFYRNFYDPYAREWQNGNSRWDLIDVVRATKALRPEGINWPRDTEGRPSFKLEDLAKANGLRHEAAHDALSDVYATIALARLLKSAQPKLYQYLWRNRTKTEAFNLLEFASYKPVVHVSGRYSSLKNCIAVVLPICKHPVNTNGTIVYDLSIDPGPLLSLSAQEVQQRLFTAVAELPEGIERIPLKTVHINKCPVLAPISVLRPVDEQRLNISLTECYQNIAKIKNTRAIEDKIARVFSKDELNETALEIDPDLAIYSGGFFSGQDKRIFENIRAMLPETLAQYSPNFTDPRLKALFFRYRARNYPESLSPRETVEWRAFCRDRITGNQSGGGISLEGFIGKIQQLRTDPTVNNSLLSELEAFASDKIRSLELSVC